MSDLVAIRVPGKFVPVVSGSTQEDLADLRSATRKLIDKGLDSPAIVTKLEEAGWDKAFAEWYVEETARSAGEIDLKLPPKTVRLAVPPQFARIVSTSSAEDIEDLHAAVRKLLDQGREKSAIVAKLLEAGWDPAFAEWYVGQAESVPGKVEFAPLAVSIAQPGDSTILDAVEGHKYVRMGLLVFALGVFATIGIGIASAGDSEKLATAIQVSYLGQTLAVVLTLLGMAKAAKALNLNVASTVVMGVIVALLPFGFLVLLISFSVRMSAFYKQHDIVIGFLGPNSDSLRKALQRGKAASRRNLPTQS